MKHPVQARGSNAWAWHFWALGLVCALWTCTGHAQSDDVAAAKARYDRAYQAYIRLMSQGGAGSVTAAQAEYKAAFEALKAIEARRGQVNPSAAPAGPAAQPAPTPPAARSPSAVPSGQQAATPPAVPPDTTPFAAFRLDRLAEQATRSDARFPWGAQAVTGAPADANPHAGTTGSLTLAMNRVQALQGRASTQPLKDFDAIWAPFFQHPTAQNQAYFERVAPALDEFIGAANEVEALAPSYRDSVVDLAVAAAAGNDRVTRVALNASTAQANALEASQRKMQAAVQRIRQLGNPQNPLAALQAARSMHRAALAKPAPAAVPTAPPPPPPASAAAPCTNPYGDCGVSDVRHVNVGNQPKAFNPLLKEVEKSTAVVRSGLTMPTSPGTGTGADTGAAATAAASDSAARDEAIAHHLALARQRDESARRWAADAQREKDPVRQRELRDRAEFDRDMAQAERDLASSLQTGEIVHTRTDWQNEQARKLIVNMQAELVEFNKEQRRVQLIPKIAALIGGPEGTRIQGEIPQRIREALSAPDRGARLDQLYAQLQRVAITQRAADLAQKEAAAAQADADLAAVEGIKAGADAAFFASTWLVPGGGAVSLAYGLGTGYAEGGLLQVVENSWRAYSEKVDVVIAAVRGGLEVDESGQRKGVLAGIKAGLSTAVTNKLMNVSAGKTTGLIQGAITKGRTGAGAGREPPRPEAFKDNHERYREAMKAATTPAQQQAVKQRFRVIVERESMKAELAETTRRHERALPIEAHGPDGSVDTRSPAYQKSRAAWLRDMAAVREKYQPLENRGAIHDAALKAASLGAKDVPLSGGAPKSLASDMDVTPTSAVVAGRYVRALRAGGHEVQDYPDRWVVPGLDLTIWKSGQSADKPGSSSYEAAVIHDALFNSDKFPTQGGLEYTTQSGVTYDPKGAVIANYKKAHEAGVVAGKGDTHVVGKSLDKAVEISGATVDPQLLAQARAKRQHLTDEEAQVSTFGASGDVKAREQARYMSRSQDAFTNAIELAGQQSDKFAAVLKRQLADAEGRRDQATANDIRAQLARYRISNDVALQTLARRDPAAVAALLAKADPGPSSTRGFGWLMEEMARDRQALARHAAQPAPPLDLPGVGDRCRAAATQVATQLSATRAGSAEAVYLAKLKSALDRGVTNPGQAVTEVRLLSGFELAEVLRDLAPAKR